MATLNLNELSLIDKAIDLAMDVHSSQFRKISKKPYFLHPFRVYQAAISNGLSKQEQIISLLHDVYEDGQNKKYIINRIKELFGSVVLKAIILLSHDKNVDYNKYLLFLAKQNKIVLNVKILDIIENLSDAPNKKQKDKYINGIIYLLKNGIKINTKLLKQIDNLAK